VLLEDQDRSRWDPGAIKEGTILLQKALRMKQPLGPYQLQAAIAANHAQALRPADTDWCKEALGEYRLAHEYCHNDVEKAFLAGQITELETNT
jgi:predicted RNA polymerase sigma factor